MAEDFGLCRLARGRHVRGRHVPERGPRLQRLGQSQDLSPIGSAGHYQGYLLVEVPLAMAA